MNDCDKLPGEPSIAYEWFCKYRDMGIKRSTAKVVQKYGRKPTYRRQLERWSHKNNWVKRVDSYDKKIMEVESTKVINKQLQAAREQVQLADTLTQLIYRVLEVLKEKDITVLQWKGLAEFAIKTKMDALGIIEQKRPHRSREHNTKFLQRIIDEAKNRNITSLP